MTRNSNAGSQLMPCQQSGKQISGAERRQEPTWPIFIRKEKISMQTKTTISPNMQIQIFDHPEFGKIRSVLIDGEPWLVGKDVAKAMGYSNTKKALIDHVDAEDKGVTKRDPCGNVQQMVIINESGLYSLILSSHSKMNLDRRRHQSLRRPIFYIYHINHLYRV